MFCQYIYCNGDNISAKHTLSLAVNRRLKKKKFLCSPHDCSSERGNIKVHCAKFSLHGFVIMWGEHGETWHKILTTHLTLSLQISITLFLCLALISKSFFQVAFLHISVLCQFESVCFYLFCFLSNYVETWHKYIKSYTS